MKAFVTTPLHYLSAVCANCFRGVYHDAYLPKKHAVLLHACGLMHLVAWLLLILMLPQFGVCY